MDTYPVESALLELLFFHSEVGFFFSKLGVDPLEDAEEHEHVGVVRSLFMEEDTLSRAGLSLT